MWWGLFGLILAISAIVVIFRGPVAGLGTGVLVSLLFPCWLMQAFAGVEIDLRVATAMTLLIVNVMHSKRRISWRFSSGDWMVFALYFVHVASDTCQDGLQLLPFMQAFGEWSIPYIAGRLAVQNVEDWRWLTRIAVIISMIFAVWATTESITQMNVANLLFYSRPADRTPLVQIRLSVKRAEGPTHHPIWFGMIQTLLIPFTIAAAYRAVRLDGPNWWIITPLCAVCGIMATVSRGPLLAAIGIFYCTSFLCLSRFRLYLIAIGLVAIVAGYLAKDNILTWLEGAEATVWGTTERHLKVEIDDKKHRLTALSYRWLVVSAYRSAIRETGALGYGTARLATFPPNVPLGPDARQTLNKFWSVDSEYLLLLLRFGWLGLATFIALLIVSIIRITGQAQFVSHGERLVPLTIAATLVAVAFALVVEWMPHDYGFLLMWLCGSANGPRLDRPQSSNKRSH